MIWLILLTIGVAYAMYSIGKFADDLNPYNFFSTRDNNR